MVYYYNNPEDPIRCNTYGNIQTSREMSLKSWSGEEKYPFAGARKHGVTSS
jgi:hypothetical protein